MEVSEAMLKRRSVRKFQTTQVKQEDILTLLQYAMSGPSACNKKPWEFYVVQNKEMLTELRGVTRFTNMVSPLNIIVAGNTKKALPMQMKDFWIQDCSAAIENILLGVVDLGLGACWCGITPNKAAVKKVQDILGLEKHMEPLGMLHIGYPAEEHEPRTQYAEEKVHWLLDE